METSDSNLITAIKRGDAVGVRQLLISGADPNAREHFSFRGYIDYFSPALNVAVRATDERGFRVDIREDTSLVQALLEHGADVNGKDTHGFTPIRLASWRGWRQTVHLLLDHGADVNAIDYQGLTPLMMAAMRNHSVIVRDLLERGANIDQQSHHGMTALMSAADWTHLDSLAVLIDWGADTRLKDSLGRTALDLLDYRKDGPNVTDAIALLELR